MKNIFGMKVFRIDRVDKDEMLLTPHVPTNISEDEDNTTKRICCSASINGCLSSVDNFNYHDKLYVYECDVNFSKIYQPTEEKVYDAYLTGELWIIEPIKPIIFKKCGMIEITGYIGQDYKNRVNNQYSFIYKGKDVLL